MVGQTPEDHPLQGSRLAFALIEQPNDEGGSVAMLESQGLQFFGGRAPFIEAPAAALGRILSYQILNLAIPPGASLPLWHGVYGFQQENTMPELPLPVRVVREHVSVFSILIDSAEQPPEARIGVTRLVPKDVKVVNGLREAMHPFAYHFLTQYLRTRDEGLISMRRRKDGIEYN